MLRSTTVHEFHTRPHPIDDERRQIAYVLQQTAEEVAHFIRTTSTPIRGLSVDPAQYIEGRVVLEAGYPADLVRLAISGTHQVFLFNAEYKCAIDRQGTLFQQPYFMDKHFERNVRLWQPLYDVAEIGCSTEILRRDILPALQSVHMLIAA